MPAPSPQPRTIELDFASPQDLSAIQCDGLSQPEPHGCWTDGPEARLLIRGLDPSVNYAADLELRPYTAPPAVAEQQILIILGDTEMGRHTLSGRTLLSFEVPAAAISTQGDVQLRFLLPDAVVPSVLKLSTDGRMLGFSLRRLKISPVAGPEPRWTDPSKDAHGREPLAVKTVRHEKRPLAAVTMVFNEAEFLPMWIAHYSRHVGKENCYVVDHGSTDGSTAALLDVKVIRIPRSPYDTTAQSTFNAKFCSSLLSWYRHVIYADVDEIILPDPSIAPSLTDYCNLELPDITTAIGLNVQHVPALEPEFRFGELITAQRHWLCAASSMCKPILISRDVRWPAGSHSADARVHFHHLYMFHLRWFDLNFSIRRLARTRAMDWADIQGAAHQRLTDEVWNHQFGAFASLPCTIPASFEPDSEPLRGFLSAVAASQKGREFDRYKIDLDIWGRELWKIPERFIGCF
jgi:hypothetical protein